MTKHRLPFYVLLLLTGLVLGSCEEFTELDEIALPPSEIVVVSGDEQTGTAGAPLATDITVHVRNEQGSGVPWVKLSWEVMEGGSGAAVSGGETADADGRATVSWTMGQQAGPQVVRVRVEGVLEVEQTLTVSALPGPVSDLSVSPTAVQLTAIGASTPLDVTATDAYGNPVPNPTVSWSTSDASVAEVVSGAIVARGTGAATLTGTSGSATVTVDVTVVQDVATVTVTPTSATVGISGTTQLTATLRDASGSVVTGATPTWRSLSTAIATVSGSGEVTGVAEGTTHIVVEAGTAADTAAITVSGTALATVAGTVVVRGDPSPDADVPLANVEVQIAGSSVTDTVVTGPDGRYERADLDDGSYTVTLLAPHLAPEVSARNVTLSAGSTTTADFAATWVPTQTVSQARAAAVGELVAIAGRAITATDGSAGTLSTNTFYIQSDAGIGLYLDTLALPVQIGDSVGVYGSRGAFRTDVQVSALQAVVLGSGSAPAPVDATIADLQAQVHMGELARLTGVTVDSVVGSMVWVSNGAAESFPAFIDPDSGIDPATDFTVGTAYDLTGVVAAFDGLIELKPRMPGDVVESGGSGGGPSLVTVADARTAAEAMDSTEVAITGVVTVSTGVLDPQNAWLQDGTGGILIRMPAGGSATAGDSVVVYGVPTTYQKEAQLRVDSATVVGTGTIPAHRPVSVGDMNAGLYQGELATLGHVTVSAVDSTDPAGWYQVTVADTLGASGIVFVDTDAGIPTTAFAVGTTYDVDGVLSRFNDLMELKPLGPGDVTEVATIGPAATVDITPDSIEVPVGNSYPLDLVAIDADGDTIPSPTVSWNVIDGAIASVDGTGLVTAVAEGTTSVFGTVDGVSDTTVVTVQPCVAGTTGTLSLPDSVVGALDSGDCAFDDGTYVESWALSVPADTTLIIELLSSAFDAYLYLMDANTFAVLDANDDGAGGTNARLVTSVAAGDYLVLANSFTAGETGEYSLTVADSASSGGTGGSGSALTWQSELSPPALEAGFNDVWTLSPTDIWASSGGYLVHNDGSAWTTHTGSVYVNALWGTSSSHLVAVGRDGGIQEYDGTGWTTLPAITTEHLSDVSGTSATDVFAVGANGTILHDDGTGWSAMSSGTTENLRAVWAASSTDVYAAGDAGTLLHYDGTSWSALSAGTSAGLTGVWGAGGEVWVVGDWGTVLHYDGSSWSQLNLGVSNWLNSVWATSATDVYAAGEGVLLHYDGVSWTVDYHTGGSVGGLSGSSSSFVLGVGTYGLVVQWDGAQWSYVQQGFSLNDVWAASATDVYATSFFGELLHFDGTGWYRTPPMERAPELRSVWAPSATDVFMAGNNGRFLHYDGVTWTDYSTGGQTHHDLWGSSSTDIFAVGSYGSIAHFDGVSWTSMTSGTTQILLAVWGTSASDVWAVGYNGTVLYYDGSTWTSMSPGSSTHFYAVWASGTSDIFIGGESGEIRHYDGTTWTLMSSGTSSSIRGLWGSSATDVYAVGDDGILLHYDGTSWSAVGGSGWGALRAVHGASADDVWAVGHLSRIYHGSP